MADIYLSEENDLALAAATLLQPDSSLAWEKLLKLVEFEDLNDSIYIIHYFINLIIIKIYIFLIIFW